MIGPQLHGNHVPTYAYTVHFSSRKVEIQLFYFPLFQNMLAFIKQMLKPKLLITLVNTYYYYIPTRMAEVKKTISCW